MVIRGGKCGKVVMGGEGWIEKVGCLFGVFLNAFYEFSARNYTGHPTYIYVFIDQILEFLDRLFCLYSLE